MNNEEQKGYHTSVDWSFIVMSGVGCGLTCYFMLGMIHWPFVWCVLAAVFLTQLMCCSYNQKLYKEWVDEVLSEVDE